VAVALRVTAIVCLAWVVSVLVPVVVLDGEPETVAPVKEKWLLEGLAILKLATISHKKEV